MSGLPDSVHLRREVIGLVCGKRLGSGIGREVYVYAPNPAYVIKFEGDACSFQNVKEWEVWQAVSEVKDVARWFAPCHMISPSGAVLIQKRTQPVPDRMLPEKMPAFLTDFKRENYGLLDGRVVCHDYGMHLMLEKGMTKRMRKADWWSHEEWDS